MRRLLVISVLAGCTGGGEGGGTVVATVQLRSTTCAIPDPRTVVASGTLDVFMRDTLQLIVFASSNAFPVDGGLNTSAMFECGAWEQGSNGCSRVAGDPTRETIDFSITTNLDFDLPADVSISVSAFISGGDFTVADDFEDLPCP